MEDSKQQLGEPGAQVALPSRPSTSVEGDTEKAEAQKAFGSDVPDRKSTSPERDTERAEAGDAEKAAPPKAWGSDAPDGGLTAWLVILGTWCTSFCSFGWLNSIGVFQEYYQNVLLRGYSASTISWIPSLQIFIMMGLGPFVGVIFDRYGPRWLLLIGTILHVLGIMMASLGTQYYQIILAQGICSAIGAACVFQPSVTCAAGWFNKNRGAALGVTFTGSSIGGVIFPIMVSRLINEVGFGWAMRACGFLVLLLLIIANLTIKPFYPPHPHRITGAQLRRPFKEIDFVLLTCGFYCFSWGFFPPLNYIELEAASNGMASHLVEYLVPMLNAGSLFGRLGSGFLGDRTGRYNIFVVVCYLSGLWILALWIPASNDAGRIAFAVIFGFFSGAYVSLITPLVMAISPMPELGFRTGIVMFACAIAGLTANPINGALVDGPNSFLALKIWSGIFCVVGTTFVLVARIRRVGWKLTAVY